MRATPGDVASAPRWIPPLGLAGTLALGTVAAVVGVAAEHLPAPEAWRRLAAASVLLFIGVWLLRGEALDGTDWRRERVGLRALTLRDWAFALAGTLAAAGFAALLDVPRVSLFVAPFALAQIVADEWLWRGVALPRHEAALGAGWLVNGIVWWLVQLATLGLAACAWLPLAVILPLVRRSTQSSLVPMAVRGALLFATLS